MQVDLATRRVVIEPVGASGRELHDAIAEAEYTPVSVEATASPGVAVVRKGCCCA